MTKNTVRHVLLELERAGWDSLCNQTGSEYYGELMLPNALMVLANGIAMDRDMVVSALSESPPYLRWCAGILLCMTVPARSAAQEAAAVTQTALALAGHELDPFTREVTDKMGRGELTGDEAVEAIIAHFAGRSQPVQVNDYRRWEDYFWPDAPDVLRNKLGIRDQRMLNFVEAQLSAVRIYEQVLENRTGAFNFAHYCDIHRRTFSDIFDWAGIPRTVPDGPMTKRHRDVVNFLINDPNAPTIEYRYRPGPQVRDGAEYVFARLQAEDALTGLPPEQFIRRLGTYWGSVDSVHPFRDGNTRTETVFFHQLCRNAGYDLGAERLYARRTEFVAARFHGHATGDRYRRLTALLTETVEVRPSRELTARETSWAQGLYQSAEQNADLLRRVQQQRSRRDEGPSLEL